MSVDLGLAKVFVVTQYSLKVLFHVIWTDLRYIHVIYSILWNHEVMLTVTVFSVPQFKTSKRIIYLLPKYYDIYILVHNSGKKL
jgi:hypothetical protein